MPLLIYSENPYSKVRLGRFDANTEAERTGWDITGSWYWASGSQTNMEGWFIDDSEVGNCISDSFILDSQAKYIRLYHRANGNAKQYVQLLDNNNQVLTQHAWEESDNNYYQRDLDISAYVGQIVKIRFIDTKAGAYGQMGVRNIRIVDTTGSTLLPFED